MFQDMQLYTVISEYAEVYLISTSDGEPATIPTILPEGSTILCLPSSVSTGRVLNQTTIIIVSSGNASDYLALANSGFGFDVQIVKATSSITSKIGYPHYTIPCWILTPDSTDTHRVRVFPYPHLLPAGTVIHDFKPYASGNILPYRSIVRVLSFYPQILHNQLVETAVPVEVTWF